ncbi:MAG: ATP-binding protein [Gammaproteobacteria bacterium]|nr:ATP-binding protein [Gammaproteobacteria bacterium]
MIEREITPRLAKLFGQYPFVTVTGPRQSGKTTLCRATFPDLKYVNLELPDQREFAQSDPHTFLSRLGEGAILDEIQRVPDLLSYLQVLADEKGRNSLFVLTGSEHFMLSKAISQSLAGRTGLLHLLPFSLAELRRMSASNAIDEILYSGFYPRVHDQKIEPRQAYTDYFETYVTRDVRQLSEIRNLSSFQRFVRLCAGRVGQLTDLSALGADAGISHTTARHWLEILEASYLIFRLPPFHANLRKRLVKSPKLYFYDVGLASYLIGIERASQIETHPLRGALFENMVVAEALKHRFNLGRNANLSFFRDSRGLECDLLFETARGIGAIEIKSGATVASDFFDALNAVEKLIPKVSMKAVVFGGGERQSRSAGEVVPFVDLRDVLERFEAGEG